MRSPALTVYKQNGARPTTQAGRELEHVYLHMARQLRARYCVTLRGVTARGLANALATLVDQGRLDIAALRADLDGRDERELTRLLLGDNRLQLSLTRSRPTSTS
jgi:hypothetical protein